jgi:hypothetical protein
MVQNIEEVFTSKRAKKRTRQNSSKQKRGRRESKFENYNAFFEEPILKEPSFSEVMKQKLP